MVNAVLQETVVALSRDERVGLRDFIDMTLETETPVLTDEQKAVIDRRAAEMQSNPSIGLDWDDVYAELMAEIPAHTKRVLERRNP